LGLVGLSGVVGFVVIAAFGGQAAGLVCFGSSVVVVLCFAGSGFVHFVGFGG